MRKEINLTIKKGNKGILRFPTFLHSRASYFFQVDVSEQMLSIGNNGWSIVVGVSWLWHHWNSVRLVNRVDNKFVYFGYYAYCKGVSPQDNKVQKSTLSDPDTFLTTLPTDRIYFEITPFRNRTEVYLRQSRGTLYGREVINSIRIKDLPPVKYMHWPIWMTEPHIKDKATVDIPYKITLF